MPRADLFPATESGYLLDAVQGGDATAASRRWIRASCRRCQSRRRLRTYITLVLADEGIEKADLDDEIGRLMNALGN
ncbi:MAG: hypothetical protein O2819_06540 [Planctomycetota bacterium]|nr:hypothetical protein [Planctomycetota bacterium]